MRRLVQCMLLLTTFAGVVGIGIVWNVWIELAIAFPTYIIAWLVAYKVPRDRN